MSYLARGPAAAGIDSKANALQETAVPDKIPPRPFVRNPYGSLYANRFPVVCNYGQQSSLKMASEFPESRGHIHRFSLAIQQR